MSDDPKFRFLTRTMVGGKLPGTDTLRAVQGSPPRSDWSGDPVRGIVAKGCFHIRQKAGILVFEDEDCRQ
jgi:hypothetical protein